jgi:hypothetical protein
MISRRCASRSDITYPGLTPQSVITFAGEPTCSTDLLDKKAKAIYEAHLDLTKRAGR